GDHVKLHALVESGLAALEQIAATDLLSVSDFTDTGRSNLEDSLLGAVRDGVLGIADVSITATVTESVLIGADIVQAGELPHSDLVDADGKVSLAKLVNTELVTLEDLADRNLFTYADVTAPAK